MLPGQREVVPQFTRPGLPAQGGDGQPDAAENPEGLDEVEPVLIEPEQESRHPCDIPRARLPAKRGNYTEEGMSPRAITSVRRGTRTMRSPGPQPASAGNEPAAEAVMSEPMMAKSPVASSKMSGQLRPPAQRVRSGEGPSRRRIIVLERLRC